MSSQSAVKESLEDIVVKVVDEFGLYKVKTVGDNKELVGWVFPKVVDLEGTVLPMAVFSNGSQSAMQENIAGSPIDRSTDILDAPPKGVGCFYFTTGSGATGLVPVSIKAEIDVPDGSGYQCETVLGETCIIAKTKGLKTVEKVGQGRYAIPEECGFMPLENVTDLVAVPEDFAKTAAARDYNSRCRIMTDGTCYTFQGPEVSKVASVMNTQFLNKDEAVFLGTILGQEPTKLAHLLDDMRGRGNYDTVIAGRSHYGGQGPVGQLHQSRERDGLRQLRSRDRGDDSEAVRAAHRIPHGHGSSGHGSTGEGAGSPGQGGGRAEDVDLDSTGVVDEKPLRIFHQVPHLAAGA